MKTFIIKHRNKFFGLIVALFWLIVWQLLSMAVSQVLLLPSPWTVLITMWHLLHEPTFWISAGASLLRIVIGFLLGVAGGCVLAFLTTRFSLLHRLFSPLLHIVRAAPVASFIILALVWIQTNFLPAFIAFLMVLPLVWANMETGIRKMDPNLAEIAKVYRLGRGKTFWKIKVPSLLPYFMSACTTGLGFAWKSGIAAEVICRPAFSIGRQLQDAKTYLETPSVFAWTALVIILSILLDQLLRLLIKSWSRRIQLHVE